MISRYEDANLARIWGRENQISIWASIERVWAGQFSTAAQLDMDTVPAPTPAQLAGIEARTHHEFTAFLDAWGSKFSSAESARWLHYGLTSSDVIDTGTALQLVDTHRYVNQLIGDLQAALHDLAGELQPLAQVGRTHGQWAQPRSADIPIRALFWMLHRQAIRLDRAGIDLAESDLSGPTGARTGLDPEKVHRVLTSLGLRRAPVSTQIALRDGWVHWAHCVTGIVTICEAVATHFWTLAQSEIAEVEVTAGSGSSAMPHKRGNPHVAENIRGLARLARALASTLDESMVQFGDRDLAHSSVERVALPDLAHLAATTILRTTAIVRDWRYVPDRVGANLATAMQHKVNSATLVMEAVRGGSTRTAAMQLPIAEGTTP